MNSLVRFWNECDLRKPPFIHPADLSIAKAYPKLFDTQVRNLRGFIHGKRFGDFRDNRFHLSLIPSPYGGRLDTADIFILLLNPGFGISDYHVDPVSRRWKKRVIRQKLARAKFPFASLNPNLCWRPGFMWWEKKLRSVIRRIVAEKFDGSYLDAMRNLSQRLACIELVPYHSASFNANKLVKVLPSARAARDFVYKTLLPKARRGKVTLIVTRKVKEWGLPKAHVVTYTGGHTRGAHMSVGSMGGKAILKRYGIK
jgi:hypothetical protein